MVNGSSAPLIKDQSCSQGPFQLFPEATSRRGHWERGYMRAMAVKPIMI